MSRTASEASTSSLTNAVLRNFNGFLDFVLEFWLATRLSCNNRLNHKSQCLVWICRPPNGCGATQLQSKYLCTSIIYKICCQVEVNPSNLGRLSLAIPAPNPPLTIIKLTIHSNQPIAFSSHRSVVPRPDLVKQRASSTSTLNKVDSTTPVYHFIGPLSNTFVFIEC
ncbi:hypothetical protein PGTUg99_003901 [Puccinia graminis f. sp. tritici]|uniref:Uncharacterized protein n=1 Tax=Puccinia graminis f. sp. tritici TaxID=56615 RepID=A0A5B0PQP6_PUCGR|nr:hypothetical protein PGTUg99_003901 [Puccinia graminis f. sp. tritici]